MEGCTEGSSKQSIVDPSTRHAMYHFIADTFGEGALPKWNFAKVLIGKDSTLKGLFPEAMAPTDPQITTAIERELNVGWHKGGTMNFDQPSLVDLEREQAKPKLA